MMRCLAAALFLVTLLTVDASLSATGDEAFKRFRNCIKRCSLHNAECNEEITDLWGDYFVNKRRIMRHLRDCCLRNEYRMDARPSDSFGACARIECGAVLWGCHIQKKHSGFLSEDEKEHLKQGEHD
ncbi:hypothetical protein TcWFU_003483 [Taenia crassiceps]|uniref:Uncharacterized protein n=1 Tax=Taenia crassiceps TaxID=6207 RepID=A0ABR4Q6Y5_9CEST